MPFSNARGGYKTLVDMGLPLVQKILYNLGVTILIGGLLLVPEILISHLNMAPHKQLFALYSLVPYLALALMLSLSRMGFWMFMAITMLTFLHVTNGLYIMYFGADITPDVVTEFFINISENTHEIFAAIKLSHPSSFHLIGITIFLSYLLILKTLKITATKRAILPYCSVILCCCLTVLPTARAMHQKMYLCYPNPIRLSLYNSINTCGVVLARLIQTPEITTLEDYQVNLGDPSAHNMIVIMGESVRDDYMSIYGYHYPTTPFLSDEAQRGNIAFTKALSSGVATNVSLMSFFNVLREPGNLKVLSTQHANLFKIAKTQGYRTILISAQSATLFYGIGTQNIDHFVARESINEQDFTRLRDEVLLNELHKIVSLYPKDTRYFVVLHMRSMHAPFEENYLHKPDLVLPCPLEATGVATRQETERSAYCNAMRFNDLVIEGIVKYARLHLNRGNSYVFYTSDHAELLGEDGLYGHNHLHSKCAQVPLIAWQLGKDDFGILHQIRETQITSHYDIGLMTASLLGATIYNPNDSAEGVRYIMSQIHAPEPKLEYKTEPNSTNRSAARQLSILGVENESSINERH
jgi:glucan phosphoethanolaminetransferase (alkaline phosphatase superfamily)